MSRTERRADLEARVARALIDEQYVFSAARRTHVFAAGKVRPLAALTAFDPLAHKQLARWLGDRLKDAISENARAFKKGDSAELTAQDFAYYVAAHRRAHADPKARGLYVLRADVSSYGDSIPVHEHAPLWPILDKHTARASEAPSHEVLMRLVRRALTPPIDGIGTDGAAASQLIGLPTGSALLPVVENIYLDTLDRALTAIDGAFYARYGDDILFAHPSPEPRRQAEAILLEHLGSLGLSTNEKKMQRLYFTAAGRASELDSTCHPAQYVEYLGCRIAFDATVALTHKKWRKLLLHVRELVANTHALLQHEPRVVEALCAMLQNAFDDQTPLAHAYIPIAMRVLTDRAQLKELDYAVALAVAERITGERGVRAFRKLPYKKLRRAGLPSLVMARNRRG